MTRFSTRYKATRDWPTHLGDSRNVGIQIWIAAQPTVARRREMDHDRKFIKAIMRDLLGGPWRYPGRVEWRGKKEKK